MLVVVAAFSCKGAPEEPTEGPRKIALSASAAASSAPVVIARPPASGGAFIAAMNDFCVVTQQVNDDAKVKKADRPIEIVKRLLGKSPPNEFLDFLRSLGDLGSGERYAALKKAAADRGAPNWSCPALSQ